MTTNTNELDSILDHPAWQGWHFIQVDATSPVDEDGWLRLTGCVQGIVQKYLSHNLQLHTIMTRRTNTILLLHKPPIPELVHQVGSALHQCLALHKVKLDVRVRDLSAELKN